MIYETQLTKTKDFEDAAADTNVQWLASQGILL
jgi:hypothetical protein